MGSSRRLHQPERGAAAVSGISRVQFGLAEWLVWRAARPARRVRRSLRGQGRGAARDQTRLTSQHAVPFLQSCRREPRLRGTGHWRAVGYRKARDCTSNGALACPPNVANVQVHCPPSPEAVRHGGSRSIDLASAPRSAAGGGGRLLLRLCRRSGRALLARLRGVGLGRLGLLRLALGFLHRELLDWGSGARCAAGPRRSSGARKRRGGNPLRGSRRVVR